MASMSRNQVVQRVTSVWIAQTRSSSASIKMSWRESFGCYLFGCYLFCCYSLWWCPPLGAGERSAHKLGRAP